MMHNSMLNRLATSLLLLTTVVAMSTVDAFSSSLPYHERSRSSAFRPCIALFGRKHSKMVEFVGDEDNVLKSNKISKRKGMIQRDVKKLNWLSSPKSRRSYRNVLHKKGGKYGYGRINGGFRQRIVYRWRGFRQKIRQIIFRNTVYVLECEHGKYYVGSTKNRKQRYYQHFQARRGGSKWTKIHKPIRVHAEFNRIPSRYVLGMESQTTAEYMMKFGVNNVRGAAFCRAGEFTTDDISDLTGFLGHYNQLSYSDLNKELYRALPRPEATKSYSRPPARVYRATKEKSNKANVHKRINEIDEESKTRADRNTTSELPKAVVRSRLRKSKRKERKKRRASERKNYKPSDSDEDNEELSFKDEIDWTMEI